MSRPARRYPFMQVDDIETDKVGGDTDDPSGQVEFRGLVRVHARRVPGKISEVALPPIVAHRFRVASGRIGFAA